MAAHALLSASGSKRWLSCPPSARLEQNFPESRSEYADEGSFAHSLGELKLRLYIGEIDQTQYDKDLTELKKSRFYSEDLESYVDIYVDFVKERINTALAKTKDAVIMLEQRLDFSAWVPEGFGTGDVVIVADGYIEVIDLKFGKGVAVSAVGNTQMQLYALGAYNILNMLYDIETVRMSICQPRLDDISDQEMAVQDLLAWGDQIVKPIAAKAIKGEGDFAAGDHCRFCRAKATCRARAEANLELARYDFQDTFLLSDDEITDVLSKAEQLQAWAADVQAYALDQAANHGKKWPGWKLVEGRSNRKYTDENKVMGVLKGAGYDEDKYAPRELLGITALEKEITKRKFGELLSDFIVKPAGKPVLVPEADKRLEISSVQSAINDFSAAV